MQSQFTTNGHHRNGVNGVNGTNGHGSELNDSVDLLPHDIAAEEAVLGSLLIDGAALDLIRGRLHPADFYSQRNRKVYDAILRLADGGSAIDQISVSYQLMLNGSDGLEVVGGAGYLGVLVANTPTSTHIETYAKGVRDCADRRRQIHGLAQLAADIPTQSAAESRRRIADYASDLDEPKDTVVTARAVSDSILDLLNSPDDGSDRIATGFPYLDEPLGGGLKRGELTIIAALPKTGKTALAVHLATRSAEAGAQVFFASLEMSAVELSMRAVANHAQIDSLEIRAAYDDTRAGKVVDAIGWYGDLDIAIDERASATAQDVCYAARRQYPAPDMVIVDHLQLLDSDEKDTRNNGLDRATRALKSLARELDCVVLCLSQLNRTAREKEKPTLAMLRDSGTLEQNSDVVGLLYEDSGAPTHWQTDVQCKLKLELAKNRNGRSGYQSIAYHKPTSRFTAWDVTYAG